MIEKNVLLISKKDDEVVAIRPYTSVSNVEGLSKLISSKAEYILNYVKEYFVQKEEGKGLSTNDFTDEYVTKITDLQVATESSVNQIKINGEVVTNDSGAVDLQTIDEGEIEESFNNSNSN